MLKHDEAALKPQLFEALRAVATERDKQAALARCFAPNARYFGCHPIEELTDRDAISAAVWEPLARSFGNLRRSDDMFIGGSFGDGDWISATGHLHGVFLEDYFGIPATGNWASLRYGEFHEVDDGRIVRSHVIYDLPDLMRQAGVFPWHRGLGVETLTPGPQSRDGIVLHASDPKESRKSLDLVEAMIFDGLLSQYDGERATRDSQRDYWTEDMMWYGPALIGATMGIDQFYRLHEDPWETAMLPRGPRPNKATKHVTRFGDGPFCSFTGWPSIHATHAGDFLGLPASGRAVEIRVMDFYHRAGDRLNENWIFIDFPHLFLQLGIDLFERMRDLRGASRPA